MSEFNFDFESDLHKFVTENKKSGSIVCRYWLEGRCARDEECSYLHEYDEDKMPICTFKTHCGRPECKFIHIMDENTKECVNYKAGFCYHGPRCIFRHVKLDSSKLPK